MMAGLVSGQRTHLPPQPFHGFLDVIRAHDHHRDTDILGDGEGEVTGKHDSSGALLHRVVRLRLALNPMVGPTFFSTNVSTRA